VLSWILAINYHLVPFTLFAASPFRSFWCGSHRFPTTIAFRAMTVFEA
jgi:hypothetical protein